jgi:hypothetical protein
MSVKNLKPTITRLLKLDRTDREKILLILSLSLMEEETVEKAVSAFIDHQTKKPSEV